AFNVTNLFGFGQANGNRYGPSAYPAASASLAQLLPHELLQDLKRIGFNGARLAVDPAPLLAAETDALLARHFDLIVTAARRIVDAGFSCIVDIHPHRKSAVPGYADSNLIDGPDGPGFQRLRDVEVRLAGKLADAFRPDQVAFELFNEPPSNADFRG